MKKEAKNFLTFGLDVHHQLVTELLAKDPRVGAFSLETGPDGLIARVTPAPAAQAETGSRMLRQWQMVFDRTYRLDEDVRAPSFSGWISSLTGAAMAQDAMQAWLDGAVAQLRAVPHRRVLDIGCGVGLVVAALAADCTEYHAIDQSEAAVASLGRWLATQPALAHVKLAQRAAHELDDLPDGSLDLVVLNSVVQYFPDVAYLRRVLGAAARCLVPGGRIFLGDLRAASLLPVHAAAVAAATAPAGATVDEVRARRRAALAMSRELAIDPGLLRDLPDLSDIRYCLKPADADPELAAYRFDAMLVFRGGDPGPVPPSVVWDPAGGDLSGLLSGDALAVLAIPNARVARHVALARQLDNQPFEVAAGEHPEALARVARDLGYAAETRFTPGNPDGRFDILFRRSGSPPVSWPAGTAASANDPLRSELTASLRRSLQQAIDRATGAPGKVRVTIN